MTSDGIINCWDMGLKLTNTFQVDASPIHMIELNDQYFVTLDKEFVAKIWNGKGQFVLMDRILDLKEPKDKKYFVTNNFKTLNFWQFSTDTTLYKNVFQLLVNNEKCEFISYVHLSTKDLDLITQYSKIKNEKLAVESKRVQEENNVLRSFQIKKFGIYNWDRFYKNDNVIKLVADFNFGSDLNGYNDISIFLISGQDQNTIIKYSKSDWDKFSFDPSSYNQMIAVLPENKIALYDQADFKNLNLDEIKKAHKFTFKMKILDKIKSLDQLNKILTRPV